MANPKAAPVIAWYRQLAEGRVEIFLRHDKVKIHTTCSEDDAHKAVKLFEEISGKRVTDPERKLPLFDRIRQIPGQLGFEEGEPHA